MSTSTSSQRRTPRPRRAKEAVDAATSSSSGPNSLAAGTTMTTPPVPNSTEALLLFLYPATLLLGSAFSLLSPETRKGHYDAMSQSYTADSAGYTPSYFARKGNVFNVYFVKVGWFWVTAAFGVFAAARAAARATHHKTPLGHGQTSPTFVLPPGLQAVLRWALATAWWVATTQWFLGPPLIDRGFRWTGGRCHILLAKGPNDMLRSTAALDAEQLVSAAACRAIGGAWRGGHDISGHVFLLTLGSALLAMESLPTVFAYLRARKTESKNEVEKVVEEDAAANVLRLATYFVGLVAGLCLWMLLMTAVYFHTWFEKFTGLTVAFSAIASIYFLPRVFPPLRSVLGAPSL